MKPEEFTLEEYKRISSWSKEYDKQIVQIYCGAIVVCASLLSAMTAVLFKDGIQVSPIAAHALLASVLVVVPAFRYMLAQRKEIVRMAAFVYVFYELPSGKMGWEGALQKLRSRDNAKGESNDAVTWTIWSIMILTLAAYSAAISRVAECEIHEIAPGMTIWAISALIVAKIHTQWMNVVNKDYGKYIQEFKDIAR